MVDENEINSAAESMRVEEREADNIPKTAVKPPIDNKNTIPDQVNNRGLDIGTMNLVQARLNGSGIDTASLRNVFLKVDTESSDHMDFEKVSHTKIDDSVYILSQHAYEFANIFNLQVERPMSKGMISSQEIDSLDILAQMIKSLIGQGDGKATCCYSVPAAPIDSDRSNIYHERVFSRVLQQLGYIPQPINEAVAVVYSECSESDFTGIGISFGAGMTNVAVVFRSVPVITFSLSRGGDWIDENVAMDINSVSNRVTAIKEKENFNLTEFNVGNKRERRIREALNHYYTTLIQYTTRHIIEELNKITVDFPDDVPMIVSGGTSKAAGFIDVVLRILDDYEFPFEISEIKSAANPLTAVAEGCLIKSLKL